MPRSRRPHLRLSDEAIALVAARFRAMGDASRLRILNTLMAGEHGVSELVKATGLEQSNVSRHLAVLRREGLVERETEGTRAYYKINDPSVIELCEIVCGGIVGQLSETLEAFAGTRSTKRASR